MKKLLIAAIVCGGMGVAGGWYVAEEIKNVCPVEEWKEVEAVTKERPIKIYKCKYDKFSVLERLTCVSE